MRRCQGDGETTHRLAVVIGSYEHQIDNPVGLR